MGGRIGEVLRRDPQIRKVRDGSGADPECDGSLGVAVLEIVDQQRRLSGIVDEEARPGPLHVDLYPGPLARHQIDIGLVLLGVFLAEAEPWKLGE
jgi:hypothetical protein